MMSWLTLLLFCSTNPCFALNLTINMKNECPGVTLTCSAIDLPSLFFRWFLNTDEIAVYVYNVEQYPLTVEPGNATLNDLVGGVDIQILEASLNVDNGDFANFLSTITVNISALQAAGITNVSCGSSGTRTSFSLSPISVPDIPMNVVIYLEYYSVTSQLRSVSVKWNRVTSRNEFCIIHMVNYIVVLTNSLGLRVSEMEISSDSCNNNTCTSTFSFSPTNLSYRVSVRAMNIFGSSDSAISNYTICNTPPPGPPTNFYVGEIKLNSSSNHATVILWWNAPIEDDIIIYLMNITDIINGISRQLNSSNTTISTELNISAEYYVEIVAINCAGVSIANAFSFKITGYLQQLSTRNNGFKTTSLNAETASTVRGYFVEEWHIGLAGAVIVIVQIMYTVVCVIALVALKKNKVQDRAIEMSPQPTEHVQNERHGQEDPEYEDILPQTVGGGTPVIKLKNNVAYCTGASKFYS